MKLFCLITVPILLCLGMAAVSADDPIAIPIKSATWIRIQNDKCIKAPDSSYTLTDPINCRRDPCDTGYGKQFCARTEPGNAYVCKPWLTACDEVLGKTTTISIETVPVETSAFEGHSTTPVSTTNSAATPTLTAASMFLALFVILTLLQAS